MEVVIDLVKLIDKLSCNNDIKDVLKLLSDHIYQCEEKVAAALIAQENYQCAIMQHDDLQKRFIRVRKQLQELEVLYSSRGQEIKSLKELIVLLKELIVSRDFEIYLLKSGQQAHANHTCEVFNGGCKL